VTGTNWEGTGVAPAGPLRELADEARTALAAPAAAP
jgi:hypothetical protein